MNERLLNTESQDFVQHHLDSNITTLILKGASIDGVDSKELIEQIESKKRCEKKLPTWFRHKGIYYPNKLNIEQTSSEITAEYKASLVNGTSIVDLTGGFGVDCLYFSKRFEQVIHCEINDELSSIVGHNFRQLAVENIETIAIDGMEFLKKSKQKFDWLYVDPSRRHDDKGKVFFLKDCLPNIPVELVGLFEHSNKLMIKTSPLLDISVGIEELKYVTTIHVVAVNNEVKELLWILEKESPSELRIETINLKPNSQETFSFILSDEKQADATLSSPLNFLYEPNSAILKSGGFHSVAAELKVLKLHKHSHLYTSEQLIEFPGRCFKIIKSIPYNKKSIKKLGISKANITTRNFPETVQQLRKKLHISDGGHQYLFFTTDEANAKIVLICSKVN